MGPAARRAAATRSDGPDRGAAVDAASIGDRGARGVRRRTDGADPVTDLLALTAELVAVPSESLQEALLVDQLEAELGALDHLEVTRVGDNLVARTTGSATTRVLLVGHTDTVPANGNAEPRIDGDVLWGLGSTDMKAGLAVMLDLARTVTDPAVEVTYVFYAGEEVAAVHNGLDHLFRDRPDLLAGDVALLGEPTDAVIEAGCQGTMRLEVTLGGARAHTARPWMGRNAV
ncbi:MAG: succinyl-diaminopimelate desuccinylase, partial [Acidimicrobiales bacterium]|nr:succinyl-diaminopimelate desuccinylase [Acidimicrobiales bacterium]